MAKTRVRVALGCCLFALATFALAQSRNPGLWTTTITVNSAPSTMGTAGHPSTYSADVCLRRATQRHALSSRDIESAWVVRRLMVLDELSSSERGILPGDQGAKNVAPIKRFPARFSCSILVS